MRNAASSIAAHIFLNSCTYFLNIHDCCQSPDPSRLVVLLNHPPLKDIGPQAAALFSWLPLGGWVP